MFSVDSDVNLYIRLYEGSLKRVLVKKKSIFNGVFSFFGLILVILLKNV